MLWTDGSQIVGDSEQYVAPDGMQYPGNFPKGEIPGLTQVPPTPPTPPTPEQIQETIVVATQRRLDQFAKTRGYDGILSAATYATSSEPKFRAEGQRCVDLRDATWAALYTLMGEVLAGHAPMPTGFADVEQMLPALEWPA